MYVIIYLFIYNYKYEFVHRNHSYLRAIYL